MQRRPSPGALTVDEQHTVLARLHEPRIVDLVPAEVYATRDSTPSDSAVDTAPSAPTGAPAPTAAPHPPDARHAPSSGDHHNWDTTPALCTKTAGGARAHSPRTETAPRRARTRRTSGTPGTRAR